MRDRIRIGLALLAAWGLVLAAIAATAFLVGNDVADHQRAVLIAVLHERAPNLVVVTLLLLAPLVFILNALFRHYVKAPRRLAEDTRLLRARVRAAASRLDARGCEGSPPADVAAVQGGLVLVDALGRTLQDCAHQPLPLPGPASPFSRAATLVTLLEGDRSNGAHNLPLAASLVSQGLALLP